MTNTPPSQHPPTSAPPTTAGPVNSPQSSMETYHTVAETVGLMPNLRLKDNLLQIVIIGITLFVGAIIGIIANGWLGLLLGSLLGLVAGTLISGCILMVLGWIRALNRKK